MPIAGASRFASAATLANVLGVAPSTPTVISQSTSTTSLLDSGRRLAAGGFGISSSARALNQQFLNNSASINAMFSLGVGVDATVDGALLQINALRSQLADDETITLSSQQSTIVDEEA